MILTRIGIASLMTLGTTLTIGGFYCLNAEAIGGGIAVVGASIVVAFLLEADEAG